jgi:hypothetical protein
MDWVGVATSMGNLLAAVVTAAATFMLYLVTKRLAVETRRMVEASSRPHVVVTVEPNRWSMVHADLVIENGGPAPAYDIEFAFEPPVAPEGAPGFRRLSVLRPHQKFSIYLSNFGPLLETNYQVTVSWRRDPSSEARETNSYSLDLRYIKGTGSLGQEPLVQLADQVKHIREDWRWVASNWRRDQERRPRDSGEA